MRIDRVEVSRRPMTCDACPLKRDYTEHCGKVITVKKGHAAKCIKVPNGDCMIVSS